MRLAMKGRGCLKGTRRSDDDKEVCEWCWHDVRRSVTRRVCVKRSAC